jgi:hypothetical protein
MQESATLVSAHPHSMKSLVWLDAALEAAARQTVWGHFAAPSVRKTLFIESEDSRWVVEDRIRGLAKGLGLNSVKDVPGFHYLRSGPFDLVNMESQLGTILSRYQPDFVVMSTLQNLLAGRNVNEQSEMQGVNAAIMQLSLKCCPIVLITHSPWDRNAKRAMGTITQAANFLTAMHIQKIAHNGTTFAHCVLDSKMGVDVPDFTLRLETAGEGDGRQVRRIVYGGSGRPKGFAKEAILEARDENPSATVKEIAAIAGVSERHVQKTLKAERR